MYGYTFLKTKAKFLKNPEVEIHGGEIQWGKNRDTTL